VTHYAANRSRQKIHASSATPTPSRRVAAPDPSSSAPASSTPTTPTDPDAREGKRAGDLVGSRGRSVAHSARRRSSTSNRSFRAAERRQKRQSTSLILQAQPRHGTLAANRNKRPVPIEQQTDHGGGQPTRPAHFTSPDPEQTRFRRLTPPVDATRHAISIRTRTRTNRLTLPAAEIPTDVTARRATRNAP
jgi:hypothetical protein